MARHQSVGGAAEATVGQQRNRGSETLAHKSRGHSQHFAHARSALGAFIADDHDIAGMNLLAGDGGHGFLFGFKNARPTTMLQALMPADFGHATFRRKISLEYYQSAGLLERSVQRRDHFLPRGFNGTFALRLERQASHGFGRGMNIISVQQPPGQQAYAARAVHIGGHKTTGRFEIGKQGSALAHHLKIVDLQIEPSPARNAPQMQHRIGATDAIAFSNASRVKISRGRIPSRSRFSTTLPQSNATESFFGSIAGTLLKPMGESPIISITVDMVFAVYWPPQAPAPGHATSSRSCNSLSVIFPAAFAPTASNTS